MNRFQKRIDGERLATLTGSESNSTDTQRAAFANVRANMRISYGSPSYSTKKISDNFELEYQKFMNSLNAQETEITVENVQPVEVEQPTSDKTFEKPIKKSRKTIKIEETDTNTPIDNFIE